MGPRAEKNAYCKDGLTDEYNSSGSFGNDFLAMRYQQTQAASILMNQKKGDLTGEVSVSILVFSFLLMSLGLQLSEVLELWGVTLRTRSNGVQSVKYTSEHHHGTQ